MLVITYYLCGLFLLPGVSFTNYQDKLLYIFSHPLTNWWNDKTFGFTGVALLIWIMFVAWYLDNNRNYQSGKEKGTEEWGDVKKLRKTLRDKDEMKNTYLSQNIAISDNLLSNKNMLIIGGSGSYKTTSVLTPNILWAACTNVILDIKGDLLRKHGKYLIKHGVTVKSLNLINPEESDRYNPFAYISNEIDMIKLITNIQASVKPPEAHSGDPFWDDGVGLYLQAMFYYEWLQSKAEERKASFNNILKLVNMESKRVDEEGTTALQQEMNRLAAIKGDDYPPVRDYRKLKDGATETVRSIVIMVNAMLRLCETSSMKRILSDDDMNIKSLGLGVDGNPNKKTALFLVMPDNNDSFNFFISMFYTQLFDVLIHTADFECQGELPIHVRLWADEFYAGPKPNNTEKLMGTIRSRNISIVPILQSISQAKIIFPNEKWEVFMENCAAAIYLGSGPMAFSTHKYISELLGDMTIDTRNDNRQLGMQGHTSLNNGRDGRTLMTPGEVRRMPRKDCIIFLEGQYPIYDQKAIPFKTKRWLQSAAAALPLGYKHPVRVVYNEETMTYRTVTANVPIQFLDKKEVQFYKQAEKTDSSIKVFEMNEDDFLYLNWRKQPPLSEEEIIGIFQQAETEKKLIEQHDDELPEDVMLFINSEENHGITFGTSQGKTVPESGTEEQTKWDLSGSIFQCIKRHAEQLSKEQLNEILEGLEDGLSEKQVKSYFCLPAEKMNQFRRAFLFSSGKR
jgi:type IV secretion system protein VirD4